ncbi:MAG: hypothetical protein GF308_12985 [Candidatus Heimdallarchaeota archaeon]|nr:hypothetical protein [Candidatus Heimdallarchaeota archaeon]
MMDWSTFFPYVIIGTIGLFSIGLYALFSAKKFIKIVFGIQMMFMAANLLLLAFKLPAEGGELFGDPFAQTLAILITFIGGIFSGIGIVIDISQKKKMKDGNNPQAETRMPREKSPPLLQVANEEAYTPNKNQEASEL